MRSSCLFLVLLPPYLVVLLPASCPWYGVRASSRPLRIINKTGEDTPHALRAGFGHGRETERRRKREEERKNERTGEYECRERNANPNGRREPSRAEREPPTALSRGAPAVSHLHIEILREQIFLKVPSPPHAPPSRSLVRDRHQLFFSRPLSPARVAASSELAFPRATSLFFPDLHTRLRMMLFTVRHVSPNSFLYPPTRLKKILPLAHRHRLLSFPALRTFRRDARALSFLSKRNDRGYRVT